MWCIRKEICAQALFLNSSKDRVGQEKILVVLQNTYFASISFTELDSGIKLHILML